MSPEIVFVVGTVLAWAGWFLLFKAVWHVGKVLWDQRRSDPARHRKLALIASAIALVCLGIASTMPKDPGHPIPDSGARLPLVWPVLPITGWLMVIFGIAAIASFTNGISALSRDERRSRWFTAGMCLLVAVLGFIGFRSEGVQPELLRGFIPFRLEWFGAVVALAVATILAMVYTEQFARTRGLVKKGVIHATLITGCVVFGLPFVWLLSTSFKEPRDLNSTEGLIWMPRVQVTVPYDDPIQPRYRATYDGREVTAMLVARGPDGRLELEVERPLGLRGRSLSVQENEVERVTRDAFVVTAPHEGKTVKGFVAQEIPDGTRRIEIMEPESLKGTQFVANPEDVEPVFKPGLRGQNYGEMLEYLPIETNYGLVYLRNTMIIAFFSVIGTVLSSAFVGYGFARLRFPGRGMIFSLMLATMMLPSAVTMLPTFLIFRGLGWVDTLYPMWVPAFFAGAFNVFLMRQFFMTIPMELEDAAKIDGCTYLRTFWQVMMPQVQPALAVLAIWTFMGAWNNFMGPLIYINSPEKMPLAYAMQLFQSERGGEFHLMMAFATIATIPIIVLFFAAQKYFIEGVQLSGLGGR